MSLQNQIIAGASKNDVRQFIFLASSCIYPKDAPQPINEEALLTGPLEESSALYAQAKLEGLLRTKEIFEKESKAFYGLIPATVYGPGDHFSVQSHVIPSLITRLTEAQIRGDNIFEVWGTGRCST